ncbi:hypothetical protein [Ensifer sp. MJa1]|uniref:hypothetical protein n=1 Tax=Ensifer sp. MJa1 TaxID=2919888 RepID=UPI0030095B9D
MALSLKENIACMTSIMTAFDLQQIPARPAGSRKNDRAFHGATAWQTYCVARRVLSDIFFQARRRDVANSAGPRMALVARRPQREWTFKTSAQRGGAMNAPRPSFDWRYVSQAGLPALTHPSTHQ